MSLLRENNAIDFNIDGSGTKISMKYMLTRSFNNRDFQHSASHSHNDYGQFEELQETLENPHMIFNEEIQIERYNSRE